MSFLKFKYPQTIVLPLWVFVLFCSANIKAQTLTLDTTKTKLTNHIEYHPNGKTKAEGKKSVYGSKIGNWFHYDTLGQLERIVNYPIGCGDNVETIIPRKIVESVEKVIKPILRDSIPSKKKKE